MNQISASLGGVLASGIEVAELKVVNKRRWAVWNKLENRPLAFSRTRERALAAATRLAQLNPTNKFHVVYFDVKVSA